MTTIDEIQRSLEQMKTQIRIMEERLQASQDALNEILAQCAHTTDSVTVHLSEEMIQRMKRIFAQAEKSDEHPLSKFRG